MINPEFDEKVQKISIPMESLQDTVVRKRKRRWIYYFLCILLSFVFSRILLVVTSIAQFDFKNYALREVNYDTKFPRTVHLEALHRDAYSPLNAQILEGVISLYCPSSDGSSRQLLAEIHVPLIDVVKYRTLHFKGDITWKNIQPKAIYSLWSNRNSISVHFTGNVWFRFCYIRFKKSHSKEFTLPFPFSGDSVKNGFSVHVKGITYKHATDRVQFDLELEPVNSKIPTFLNIKNDDIVVSFGGDFPLKLTLMKQKIKKGVLRNPVMVRIEILKKNFFIYRSLIWKVIYERNLFWHLNKINIADGRHLYFINLNDSINLKNFKKN